MTLKMRSFYTHLLEAHPVGNQLNEYSTCSQGFIGSRNGNNTGTNYKLTGEREPKRFLTQATAQAAKPKYEWPIPWTQAHLQIWLGCPLNPASFNCGPSQLRVGCPLAQNRRACQIYLPFTMPPAGPDHHPFLIRNSPNNVIWGKKLSHFA
jgi:hypothetical protein